MRLHFEQVRLASMLEHNSLEAQLRKLSKRMTKAEGKTKRLDDRDDALRQKVQESVKQMIQPQINRETKRSEKMLADIRYECAQKIDKVEVVVRERLDKDYGEMIDQYNIKLEESQTALEKSHQIHENRTREVEQVLQELEEFNYIHETEEEEEEFQKMNKKTMSKDQERVLEQQRKAVRQLWEEMSTPMEHRLKFLESVVNETSEVDEYMLAHLKNYSEKLVNFT